MHVVAEQLPANHVLSVSSHLNREEYMMSGMRPDLSPPLGKIDTTNICFNTFGVNVQRWVSNANGSAPGFTDPWLIDLLDIK